MDAFFASVELLRFPQLADAPVIIGGGRLNVADWMARLNTRLPLHLGRPWGDDGEGGQADLARIPLDQFPRLSDYKGRGVITTATYPARAFGVGSAMGMMKAAKLCPQAIWLPADFDRYRDYSRRFKAEILRLAPVMENRGVDEVFIDFTDVPGGQDDAGAALAQRLQAAIRQATGLTCSIGVAPNKLLAKMASEFNKPNGIAIVQAGDLQTRIWPLPCRKINGIGPKSDAALASHGIGTIGELAAADPAWLCERFGERHGSWLHRAAWGRDDRPVETSSEPVSMSRETTFSRDLHAVNDKAELGAIFTRLCEQVAGDLARKGFVGRTVGIKLRYDDFRIVTRDQSLPQPVQDAAAIRRVAGQCLKRVDLSRRLRLLGVRVSALRRADEAQDEAVGRGESLPLF
ncbi:DNA polymerase IV [Comamonas serinivorans]|uniref:DNA polymerase IV n=1 Tax=Comamonas serinivorans TaxID=1082851 RepID=A0A1Y0ENU8_9BURK|nr:DNA polymerase IV [Comamonas serinivorans]ARU05266.1 DNA polymerase IV [Comamonas serinivorans]